MWNRLYFMVSLFFGIALNVPSAAMGQTVSTITVWNARFHYADGHTEISAKEYATESEAVAGAQKAMVLWNQAYPGEIVRAEPVAVQVKRVQLEVPKKPVENVTYSQTVTTQVSYPPKTPAAKTTSLKGKTFQGSETLQGYGQLTFRFQANNIVEMFDAKETVRGRWQQQGANVTLRFWNGNVVYRGTIDGTAISGTAFNGKSNWTWIVSR